MRKYYNSEKGRQVKQAYRQQWQAQHPYATRNLTLIAAYQKRWRDSPKGKNYKRDCARTPYGRYRAARKELRKRLRKMFGGDVPPDIFAMAFEAWEAQRLLNGFPVPVMTREA